MKNSVIRISVIVVLLALLLSTVAFASMEASHYLSYYNAYISKTGNSVKVNFEVQGTGVMDNIGVTEIYLYEKTSTYGSWTLVQTYLYTNPLYSDAMMDTNISYKDDYVSYSGNSSYQYKAYVTVYADKDGGSDSRGIIAD
jgi:hypothetical protein